MSLTVAILGRPNVGKSSLFNRLIGSRYAITDDQPGITRDRLYQKFSYQGHDINLIDTGGLTFSNTQLVEEIRFQVDIAIQEADLILFVVDGNLNVDEADHYIAKLLYNYSDKVIVVANKIDNVDLIYNIYDYYKLGFDELIAVSTIHQIGIADLLDMIVKRDTNNEQLVEKDYDISFAVFGRPNVGKSSLINAIVKEKRVVVSDIPGTTTDSVDIKFSYKGKNYLIVDTAGIRQKSRFTQQLEKYSLLRTMITLSKCDIALLVLDISQEITELDKIICSYLIKANKGLIILANKIDLLSDSDTEIKRFQKSIDDLFFVSNYCLTLYVSALESVRLSQIITNLEEVYSNYTKEIKTSVLNSALNEIVLATPPTLFNNGVVRCLYITQSGTKPPTFSLFVNKEQYLHFSYKRYITNQLRKYFDLTGVPIVLNILEKENFNS